MNAEVGSEQTRAAPPGPPESRRGRRPTTRASSTGCSPSGPGHLTSSTTTIGASMTITTLHDLASGFAAAISAHDIDALRALIHPEYINHNAYVGGVGPGTAVSFFSDWLAAFPDGEAVCEDTVTVGTLSDGTVV